jgi:hypothetical protein
MKGQMRNHQTPTRVRVDAVVMTDLAEMGQAGLVGMGPFY